MAKEILRTPVEGEHKSSVKPSAGNKEMNGESKLPQRSVSKDSVPEVTYDNVGGKK